MRRKFIQYLSIFSQVIPYNIFPRLVQRDVISIFYHAVSDGIMPHVRHIYPVVPVTSFLAALDYLQKNAFNFVSYDQLIAHFDHGLSLPPRAVHLSFDDGFSQCYSEVRPILLERGIPCTFFLTIDWLDNSILYFRHQISLCVHYALAMEETEQSAFVNRLNQQFNLYLADIDAFSSWILAFREPATSVLEWICDDLGIDAQLYLADRQPYLTTAQIRQLQTDGFTIGAHGLSHRKLGFIPKSEIEPEIVGSCRAIKAITGKDRIPFSFPQSAGNISREQLGGILERNPEIGLLFDTKNLRVDSDFMVNRVWAERPLSPNRNLHPLPEILKHAYREAWVEDMILRLRGRKQIKNLK